MNEIVDTVVRSYPEARHVGRLLLFPMFDYDGRLVTAQIPSFVGLGEPARAAAIRRAAREQVDSYLRVKDAA